MDNLKKRKKLKTKKAWLKWTNVQKVDANEMLEGYLEEADKTQHACAYSYVTFDSSAPTYNPDDPNTWTQDIFLGNVTIDVRGDKAAEVVESIKKHKKIKNKKRPDEQGEVDWEE